MSDEAAANARWEKKWADREAEVVRMTEANAQKLDQERHRALQAKKDGDQALEQAQQESARLLEELQTAKTELRMLEVCDAGYCFAYVPRASLPRVGNASRL